MVGAWRAPRPWLLLALLACNGPGGPEAEAPAGAGRFPTREKLEALRARPAPSRLLDEPFVEVARWELAPPLPDRMGATPRRSDGPADALLAGLVARRAGLLLATDEMHCVARELGRFWLAHGGHPMPSLRRFLLARCGVPASELRFAHVHGAVPPGRSEAEVLDAWRERLVGHFRELAAGAPAFAGLWFGRRGDHAVALMATARRRVRLEPMAVTAPARGPLVLRGEVLEAAEEVFALANGPGWEVVPCRPRSGVALPRFAFECDLPRGSASWVSLTLVPPGRVLGRTAVELLLRAADEPAAAYRPPQPLDVRPPEAPTPAAFAEAAAEALNPLRREAGLPELRVAEAQSAAAAELAPHFFAARLGPRHGAAADLVALGLMAGWEVDGLVERGRVVSGWSLGSEDLGRLLAHVLDTPHGRYVLLDPAATRLAAGAVRPRDGQGTSLAALFATYSVLSPEAHHARVERVRERLARERRTRGHAPPEPLPALEEEMARAASRIQGGWEPRDTLDALLEESASRLGRPVSAWIGEATDLAALELPEEFLERPRLEAAIAVATRRTEGEAWGRQVVILVVAAPGGSPI